MNCSNSIRTTRSNESVWTKPESSVWTRRAWSPNSSWQRWTRSTSRVSFKTPPSYSTNLTRNCRRPALMYPLCSTKKYAPVTLCTAPFSTGTDSRKGTGTKTKWEMNPCRTLVWATVQNWNTPLWVWGKIGIKTFSNQCESTTNTTLNPPPSLNWATHTRRQLADLVLSKTRKINLSFPLPLVFNTIWAHPDSQTAILRNLSVN